ncbi:hypothetical protein [Maribacter sp. 2210JD10-5]|uniref:hypothetical protein n=1 Tax=Maribacter sp. 2210JD10-5 TaxID=3386272 RepID=UPI0039BD2F08
MNNKIKSLLFLSCFLLVAMAFHLSNPKTIVKEEIPKSNQLADADIVIDPHNNTEDNITTE